MTDYIGFLHQRISDLVSLAIRINGTFLYTVKNAVYTVERPAGLT